MAKRLFGTDGVRGTAGQYPLDPKTIIGLLVIPAAVNYQPTILSNVPGNVAPANEETFGPVVAVEIVDTAEEAVQAANRTMYGLTGGERVRRASPTSQTSSGSTRVVENASFRSNEAPKDE